MGELGYFPSRSPGRVGYVERVRRAFAGHLERKGLRMTRQRERILDALLAADRHLSLEDLHRLLRRFGVGRATVFRNLKLLEESGLLSQVTDPEGASRFEVTHDRPHHDHLICIECGRIQEIRWPELEKIQSAGCRKLGFSVLWHRHEIFGRCAPCRSRA